MDNLDTNLPEIKPEVIEEIMSLLGDSETEEILEYTDWMEAQIMGRTLPLFEKKRINRRKYKKGKVIHTKCRIAGAIMTLLDSNKGAPTYASCKRIQCITGFSERTVRRYLGDVLDWLACEGMLNLEIDQAKGYLVHSKEWKQQTETHGDLFEPKKFVSSPWLKKHQIPFALKLKALLYPPPCQKLPLKLL